MENTEQLNTTDQRQNRLEKLKKLEAKGINAYPHIYKPNFTSAKLNEKYKDLANEEQTNDVVKVAGRIKAIRNSGMFMDVYDTTGKKSFYVT